MPYTYITPNSHGHGTLSAAVAAMISDLEQDRRYVLDGNELSATELATELLSMAAINRRGLEAPETSFCRSAEDAVPDEFRIVPTQLLNDTDRAELDRVVREASERLLRS